MGRFELPEAAEVAALPVTFRGRVQREWIDMMGHMNVAWYTHVFSLATGGLLERLGTPMDGAAPGRLGTAALEVHVRYLRELRLGDGFAIHTRLLGIGPKRFHAMHFMAVEPGGRLAATSELVGAYFDLEARRQAEMPAEAAAAARSLLAAHEALGWRVPVAGRMAP
jgi:acyl-CoA thioester hydrolase